MKPYENPNPAASKTEEAPMDAIFSAFDVATSLIDRICQMADAACGPIPTNAGAVGQEKEPSGILNFAASRANHARSRAHAGHEAAARLERALGIF